MIELTEEQQVCANAIKRWISDPESPQVFRVEGNAGTGKSTIVMQVMAGMKNIRVLYAAFTGKAALVMQQKGCPSASTIHKLIYLPFGSKSKADVEEKEFGFNETYASMLADYGGDRQSVDAHPTIRKLRKEISVLKTSANSPIFKLNPESDVASADIVVIDEVSMVDRSLGQDLLSFGTKVLVLGDPGQLPPVAGEGYFMRGEPDFTLTQIHRQAEGSPILMLATMARMGERLVPGVWGESSVVTELTPEMALSADQILCGRNKTRPIVNARMRELKGFQGPLPMPGEKLVCLRNNHEKGLLNGSLWTTVRSRAYTKTKITLTVVPEDGGMEITVLAHAPYFTWYGKTDWVDPDWTPGMSVRLRRTWVDMLQEDEKSIGFEMREAESFTFGSVLTVHKSQGSQWDNVLLIDESSSFGTDSRKHLYTGITRAAKLVTIKV